MLSARRGLRKDTMVDGWQPSKEMSRVAYRFSFFVWYLFGISRFLPNRYWRKTWLVHFGIIILVGTPFFLKRGVMAPFFRGPAPILRKKGFPAKP